MRRPVTVLGLLAGLLLGAAPVTAQAPKASAEVFMWVGANRLMDEEPAVLEDMLRFARRHGIVPYSSGMNRPKRLARFLDLCRELGHEDVWIEIGVPRGPDGHRPTALEFVTDPATREPVLDLYRELGRIAEGHGPERLRVSLFDEAPLGAFAGPGGSRTNYLEEMRLFREHGPRAFAHLREAFRKGMPEAEFGLFLHHPHNASPEAAGPYSFVEEFVERADVLGQTPDFLFSDVYRGYFMRGYGYEATNDYVRDVVAWTRAVGERFGIPAYQLGQSHTIKLGYTPSRWEIDGNVQAMLDGGADGIGWYWPNYAATDHTDPGVPADVHVSFDPFVPNAWGATGPAGSMYGTSRDRWAYGYLRMLEATGRLDPDERFDLWIYGDDLDHAEHRVSMRTATGEWEVLGWINGQRDADGYLAGDAAEPTYSYDGRWHAVLFRGLDRARFFPPGAAGAADRGGSASWRGAPTAVRFRIETPGASDGSRVAAAYAMPYRPTRTFLTEGEATRLVEERPRWLHVNALGWHVRPRPAELSPGAPVELEIAEATGADLAAHARPAVLSPDHWRRQGLDVLEAWDRNARDREHGAFHAFLDRDWTPGGGGSKYPGMVARHLFSYSVGYLLSGDDRWLEGARETHRWIMEHGWDGEHGLFFHEVDGAGEVLDDSKDLFMQLYAVTGLTLYWAVTHDPAVLETVERSLELLERHAWDAEHGGYYRTLARDLSVTDPAKAVSPQLAPVSGYLLYLHLATGDDRWLERAERVSRVVLDRMRDPGTGWLLERFDRDWDVQPRGRRPATDVNTGHNAEIAWTALRLHQLTGDPAWRSVGVELGRRTRERALLPGGMWSKGWDIARPDSLDPTTPWWIQAYGNVLSLQLHRAERGDAAATDLGAFLDGAAFWERVFVDRARGGTVLSADSAGTVVRGDKAVRTKTSYHAMEHALLLMLHTGLQVTGEPVALHFRVEDPAPGERLRPVIVEDPEVRIAAVEVDGRPWTDFDADAGWVALPDQGPVRLRVTLEGRAETPGRTAAEAVEAFGPADPPDSRAAAAWAGAVPGPFDLVLHGDGLDPAALKVELRTNPDAGEVWEVVDPVTVAHHGGTVVLAGLPGHRYFGRDIRENHLSVRVTPVADGAEEGTVPGRATRTVRAIYALPGGGAPEMARQLDSRLRSAPVAVERGALAALVLPRPVGLEPGETWTEHVEAPVRHLLPGVAEVEWLDIIFRNRR